jgi:acetyltransferase-like isoleucine patch superfamily enzyme
MKDNPIFDNYQIGAWSYGNPTVQVYNEHSKLIIGKYCSIANNVFILIGGEHRTSFVSTYPFATLWNETDIADSYSKGDTIIGNDVWIGNGSMILSGVTIGDGCVIGARSLVTKNIPPYSIVGGNPAKIIKMRFTPEQIQKLLKIQWWYWPDDLVKKAIPWILSEDIDTFIRLSE